MTDAEVLDQKRSAGHASGEGTSHSIRRLGGVDLLRHLFCACVVFQHTASSRYNLETITWAHLVIHYISVSVFGFFLISGYLASPPNEAGRGAAGHLLSRLKRTLVPYLLFSTGYAIALSAEGKMNLQEGLWRTLTLQGSGMQLYFLPFLFLVGGLVALLRLLLKGFSRIGLLSLLVLITLYYLKTDLAYLNGPHFWLIPLYLAAFLIGQLARSELLGLNALLYCSAPCVTLGFLIQEPFMVLSLPIGLLWLAVKLSGSFKGLHRRYPGSGGVYLLHTPILNFAVSIALLHLGVTQVSNYVATVGITYVAALIITSVMIKVSGEWRFMLLE